MPIFSQNGQRLIFWPKFWQIAQLREYFGSNIAEDIAESWLEAITSWVEVEMSWVEVDPTGWRWMELGGGGCTV